MADALLETAIANWEPRFCVNGVETSDYARITSGLEHWDDWCDAWCAGAEVHLELAVQALSEGRTRSAGESFARAATYFHFGKFLFVHDLDQARAAHMRAVDALNQALPNFIPPASREEIVFEGSRLVGILRVPGNQGPHPTVILIPGLDSTKEEFREVERTFLDRGMARPSGTSRFAPSGNGSAKPCSPTCTRWLRWTRPVWEYGA